MISTAKLPYCHNRFFQHYAYIALSSIHQLDLLPRLFQQVHLVDEVIDECAEGGAITVPNLRQLFWIQPVQSTPCHYASVLLELDSGEKHTLDMAQNFNADWVLIDEKSVVIWPNIWA